MSIDACTIHPTENYTIKINPKKSLLFLLMTHTRIFSCSALYTIPYMRNRSERVWESSVHIPSGRAGLDRAEPSLCVRTPAPESNKNSIGVRLSHCGIL